jgi:competence protein ComGC
MTVFSASSKAFPLHEVMIVVAIVAMLVAITVPSIARARKRAKAISTLETLQMIEGAKLQYAITHSKDGALTPHCVDLAPHVKPGSRLNAELTAGRAPDALGNSISVNPLNRPPKVAPRTKAALADALGRESDRFWRPY